MTSQELNKRITDSANLLKQKKYQDALDLLKELLSVYPNNMGVINNLALAYKNLGNYSQARSIFLKILDMEKDLNQSNVYTNAGNLFFSMGELEKCIEASKIALECDDKNVSALANMGLSYNEQGNSDEAISCFKRALEIEPKNDIINYYLANIYRVLMEYKKAINHYELTNQRLAKSNQLECIYKDNNRKLFNEKLNLLSKNDALQPLVASLSAHAAIRYEQEDTYPFCKNPMDLIHSIDLFEDERFSEQLISKLGDEINQSGLSKKTQSLLDKGVQSSGNLFLQDLPNIKLIQEIIKDNIDKYRDKFSNQEALFIKSWPQLWGLHGWLIIMQQGGSLLGHMHKEGWLSGSIYLKIPKKNLPNEGDIKFSLNGGAYPYDKETFPEKIINIKRGSMVMFPSSLFHSTIPFHSNEERITLAFDVIPKH